MRPTPETAAAASIGRAINELGTAARLLKQADADAAVLDALSVTTKAATLLNRLMRRKPSHARAPFRPAQEQAGNDRARRAAMPTPDPHRSATSAGAALHAASHYLGLAAKHAKAAGNQPQLATILDALAATRKAEHAGTAKLPRYPALQIVPRRPKKTPEEQAESDRAIANLYRAGGLPRDGTPRRR